MFLKECIKMDGILECIELFLRCLNIPHEQVFFLSFFLSS